MASPEDLAKEEELRLVRAAAKTEKQSRRNARRLEKK
jgi:hypothetical protein